MPRVLIRFEGRASNYTELTAVNADSDYELKPSLPPSLAWRLRTVLAVSSEYFL